MLYYDPAQPARIRPRSQARSSSFRPRPIPRRRTANSFLDNYTLDRLRMALARQMAAAVHAAARERDQFLSLPLGLESAEPLRRHRHQGRAAGIVIVYDLSPGAAFGLAQRSVYTKTGRAGLGAKYINCPTLDARSRRTARRCSADAKAGKMATLTLTARFQRDTGKAIIAYLPGRNYGTPRRRAGPARHPHRRDVADRRERRPRACSASCRISTTFRAPLAPRTLVFYFDCRHFMPGGEAKLAAIRLLPDPSRAAEIDRRHRGHRAHGRPADDRSRRRRQQYVYSKERAGKRRRHHEPDRCLQQQHLAVEAIAQSGHRQSLAARRRQSRQRGPRRQRRLPGLGEESDEQGPRLQDSRARAGRRLAGRLDADLRANRHRSRSARLRPGVLRRSRWPACRSWPASSCWSSPW